ncbi:helix-turn-helix transcriptional regulator [Candidatus Woesearchaeota archaeon]|nr:helix-turn-helix transcriptional regulator [Candidatus Woesearchaeota archaeon]
MTNFDARNISFTALNIESVNEIKKEVYKCIAGVAKEGKKCLLICDWAGADIDYATSEFFLQFLEHLRRKSKASYPEAWKRKYGIKSQRSKLTIINSFEATQIGPEEINRLMQLHERIFLFQEGTSMLNLPGVSSQAENILPTRSAVHASVLEKLAKDNLELLCLLFLEKKPQSGYQMLKTMAQHFHILLSQGTLYPLLYGLEKKGVVGTVKGTGREKIYELSPQAKKSMAEKKGEFLQAYSHLISFLE